MNRLIGKTTLREVRNKIPISEPAELFLTPTIVQCRTISKIEDYGWKESNVSITFYATLTTDQAENLISS